MVGESRGETESGGEYVPRVGLSQHSTRNGGVVRLSGPEEPT